MGGNDSCTQGMSELFPGDLFGLAEGRPDRFTRNRHSPRSNQFLDAERLEQINDGLELLWITRHLDGVGRGRRVNHVGPENICDPERFGSVFCLGMNLDERRLPRNEFTLIEIHDLDDIDQLIQLLDGR